jgi:hypothetical protein
LGSLTAGEGTECWPIFKSGFRGYIDGVNFRYSSVRWCRTIAIAEWWDITVECGFSWDIDRDIAFAGLESQIQATASPDIGYIYVS